jgi:hypothetical protein
MARRLSLFLSLLGAIVATACRSSSVPTAPSTPAIVAEVPAPGAPPTPVMYTLSGVVSEQTAAGLTPAEGVQLYCDSCGSPTGHTFTSTDATGFYRFAWTPAGVHPLQVWKVGYAVVDPSDILGDGTAVATAVVERDTRLDIRVIQRSDGGRAFRTAQLAPPAAARMRLEPTTPW